MKLLLASAYLEKAVEIIERRETELLEQDNTLEALVENDYFSVASALVDVGRASGEFDTANRQILAAVDEADAALNDKRQAVLDAATSDIAAVLQISDLGEAQVALNQLCGSISNSFDDRIRPLTRCVPK